MRVLTVLLLGGWLLATGPGPASADERSASPDEETRLRIRVADAVLRSWLEREPLPSTDGGPIAGDGWTLRSSSHRRHLPLVDAWGRPFLYWSDTRRFVVVSPGQDGRLDRDYDFDAPAGNVPSEPDPRSDDYVYLGSWWGGGRYLQRPMTAAERIDDATVRSVRRLSWAVQSYAIDENRFPVVDDTSWVEAAELDPVLVPVYATEIPANDGREQPLLYWSDGRRFAVVGVGSDGETEVGVWALHDALPGPCRGPVDEAWRDTFLVDGRFCQWPRSVRPHPVPH